MHITMQNEDYVLSMLKKGTKVKCIEDTLDRPFLTVGEIYTIESWHIFDDPYPEINQKYAIYLKEQGNKPSHYLKHFDFIDEIKNKNNEEFIKIIMGKERMLDLII